jgi:hypothetical protein
VSDHRETLYGKGDLRRPRDEDNWSKGYDSIKWDSEKVTQESEIEDDNA